MLCFDGEEEAAGERVDVVEAGDEGDIFIGWRWGKIAVGEDDEPPDEGKHEPGEDEGKREHQQRPAPLRVHEGGEDVLQVSAPALGHVPLDNVAVSVFEDDTFFHASGCVSGLTVSGKIVEYFQNPYQKLTK